MQSVQNSTSNASEAVATRTIAAVILAGRLRRAPIQESLNVHVLCLPVGRGGTLLESWLALIRSVPGIQQVRVVVNTAEDAAAVRAVMPRELRSPIAKPSIEVMAEPRSWRGAGGIVCDVTDGLPDDAVVLVCEGTRLPPESIDPLLGVMAASGEGSPVGAVGVTGEDSPAGVYAFRRKALSLVPRVGYFDLKEQFLPAVAEANLSVVIARLGDETYRLRDLESYLTAVRTSLSRGQPAANGHVLSGNGATDAASMVRVSARASVSGSAILDGFCIIEPGAVVEDGAVVHDSIVLWGATIGGGAVVSRSIVGPLASVQPRTRIVHTIAAREM